ncbi:unnamed protein product [Polarella glacialis]|uniref:Pentatricopeptide repeat-containing protein, chloroplastic n=1 Tax=Polarella glacialis TaxID=89957 RepID=A0A813HXN5_POLGL|nr:unnamed protein product [Polarella glacialis]
MQQSSEARWAEALQIFEESLAASGRSSDSAFGLNAAIAACGRGLHWAKALALLRTAQVQGGKGWPRPDLVSHNSGLAACERASQWVSALGILRELLARKGGLSPNEVSWNTAVSAVARGAQWSLAFSLLGSMASSGTQPGLHAANAAIAGCQRAALWELALHTVFQELPRRWGLAPDLVSFSTAVSACSDGRQWQAALWIHRKMVQSKCHPDVAAYSAAMSACERSALWADAVAILRDMQVSGQLPNAFSYAAALSACEAASQWQVALSLLAQLGGNALTPNTACINAAASAAEYAGHWPKALWLLGQLDAAEQDAASLAISVRACATASNPRAFGERDVAAEQGACDEAGTLSALAASAELTRLVACHMTNAALQGPVLQTAAESIGVSQEAASWRRPGDVAGAASILQRYDLLSPPGRILVEGRVLGPIAVQAAGGGRATQKAQAMLECLSANFATLVSKEQTEYTDVDGTCRIFATMYKLIIPVYTENGKPTGKEKELECTNESFEINFSEAAPENLGDAFDVTYERPTHDTLPIEKYGRVKIAEGMRSVRILEGKRNDCPPGWSSADPDDYERANGARPLFTFITQAVIAPGKNMRSGECYQTAACRNDTKSLASSRPVDDEVVRYARWISSQANVASSIEQKLTALSRRAAAELRKAERERSSLAARLGLLEACCWRMHSRGCISNTAVRASRITSGDRVGKTCYGRKRIFRSWAPRGRTFRPTWSVLVRSTLPAHSGACWWALRLRWLWRAFVNFYHGAWIAFGPEYNSTSARLNLRLETAGLPARFCFIFRVAQCKGESTELPSRQLGVMFWFAVSFLEHRASDSSAASEPPLSGAEQSRFLQGRFQSSFRLLGFWFSAGLRFASLLVPLAQERHSIGQRLAQGRA